MSIDFEQATVGGRRIDLVIREFAASWRPEDAEAISSFAETLRASLKLGGERVSPGQALRRALEPLPELPDDVAPRLARYLAHPPGDTLSAAEGIQVRSGAETALAAVGHQSPEAARILFEGIRTGEWGIGAPCFMVLCEIAEAADELFEPLLEYARDGRLSAAHIQGVIDCLAAIVRAHRRRLHDLGPWLDAERHGPEMHRLVVEVLEKVSPAAVALHRDRIPIPDKELTKKRIYDFLYQPQGEARFAETVRKVRRHFARPALVADVSPVPISPTDLPAGPHPEIRSWFGHVDVCRPGETWPEWRGKLLLPLLQVDCARLPYRPEGLEDVEVLVVFAGRIPLKVFAAGPPTVRHPLFDPGTNGEGWVVRTYSSRDDLQVLMPPASLPPVGAPDEKLVPDLLTWRSVDDDQPPYKDSDVSDERDELVRTLLFPEYLVDGGKEEDRELFEDIVDGVIHMPEWDGWLFPYMEIKFGGWPSESNHLLLGERLPSSYRYVFQIGDQFHANWTWKPSMASSMAIFYRDMSSPTPRWAMQLWR